MIPSPIIWLFADLKGSTELLADRDPEEARKLLDPVLERMMEAVHLAEKILTSKSALEGERKQVTVLLGSVGLGGGELSGSGPWPSDAPHSPQNF
jgi:hypothetical protein